MVENPPTNAENEFDRWVRKILWSKKWQSALVFLPRKSHPQRSLASYSPWGSKESDVTECTPTRWYFHCRHHICANLTLK